MIKFAILVAACAALTATPAMAATPADAFSGARVEITAGVDDLTTPGLNSSDLTYGAAGGVDVAVLDRVFVGAEANVDNIFNRREIGASARVGYAFSDKLAAYGKVGYTNYNDVFSRKLDGLRVGGGLEYNVSNVTFVGVEYRYSDFEAGIGRHQGLAKIGFRF